MSVVELKERVVAAEQDVAYYKSLVDSFFTGQPPEGANFDHIIMAQWGRKRLEAKATARAVLLGGQG